MTEAKKLNINAAPVLQLALVLLAHGWNIFCKAIGNNGVFRFNIDMVKQLFLHETTIALRMVGSKSLIFIQIYRPNPAEVNEPRPFTENKLTVQRNGSRTGGETYHTGGLCLNNGFKFISGSFPHIFGIFHLNEIYMQHFILRIRQDSAFANSMCHGTYRLEISPLSIREALCSLRYLHSRWADPPVGALQSDMGQPHHWLLQRHAPYPTRYSRDLYQG